MSPKVSCFLGAGPDWKGWASGYRKGIFFPPDPPQCLALLPGCDVGSHGPLSGPSTMPIYHVILPQNQQTMD